MNNNKELAAATKNETAVASASAMAIAEIRSCLQLAKMYPRDIDDARINILNTCKRPGFAPHVCYSKPIGKKKIKGISIRGAEVAANNWSNIKSMSGIVYDDDEKRIINVVSMDLQTNTSYSSQVIVDKIVERKSPKQGQIIVYERLNSYGEKVYGVEPTKDEFEVKVAAQVSKQIRNNILRLIPEDIKEEMINTANKTMQNQAAEDPKGEAKKIADAFAELSVTPSDLKNYLGHPLSKASPAQIVELRVIFKTIKDGQSTWNDYLSTEESEDKEPEFKPESWENDETPEPEEKKKDTAAPPKEKVKEETKTTSEPDQKEDEKEKKQEPKKQANKCDEHGSYVEDECPDCNAADPGKPETPEENEEKTEPEKPKRPRKEKLIVAIEEQLDEIPPGLIRREIERHCNIQEKSLDNPKLWTSFKVAILEDITEELEKRINYIIN